MVLRWVGGALLSLALIGVFAFPPQFKRYRVPSESMEPMIHLGETVNLNRGEEPQVGDIVIFHPPVGADSLDCARAQAGAACARPTAGHSEVMFIKRIVAGPGDRVAFESGRTIRNGTPAREPFIARCGGSDGCDFPLPITVPEGMYFLAGDNRGASDDSRFWGPVPAEWILGRAERCRALYFVCSPA